MRAIITILLMIIIILVLAPLQFVAILLKINLAKKIPRFGHRLILWVMGVKINICGQFCKNHPMILVCNHVSWMDIMIIGSIAEVCFISKQEVKSWPLIGLLAILERTVFINRSKGSAVSGQTSSIATQLLNNDIMVLFAEGTRGGGNKLQPFKSSLLGAAQYALKQSSIDKIMVQPLAIYYTRLHGLPLGRRYQSQASCLGKVKMFPHIISFMQKSAFDIDIVLGQPLEFTKITDRKQFTKMINSQVSKMIGNLQKNSLDQKIC